MLYRAAPRCGSGRALINGDARYLCADSSAPPGEGPGGGVWRRNLGNRAGSHAARSAVDIVAGILQTDTQSERPGLFHQSQASAPRGTNRQQSAWHK